MVNFPNIRPQSMTVGLSSNSKVFESSFNQSTSAVAFAGDSIIMTLSYDSLDSGDFYSFDEAAEMSAFQFELGGKAGIAKVPVFIKPGGPAKGVPLTSVEDQLGGLLNTKGWNPNQVILKKGDYITVNDELKMIMSDTSSDSEGNATLTIKPWLRHSPAIDSEIITQDPYGLFRLKEDENSMDYAPMNGSATFEFKEAFYV